MSTLIEVESSHMIFVFLPHRYSFLKKLYSSSLECPRSYDKLRFDPRYVLKIIIKLLFVTLPFLVCLFIASINMYTCF